MRLCQTQNRERLLPSWQWIITRLAPLGDRVVPKRELKFRSRLEWKSPAAHYDRIVTHFFLDLFTPDHISRIVEKISRLCVVPPSAVKRR
jgi:hypothetical protein